MKSDRVYMDEAIAILMQRTGKTKRQAKVIILQAMADGRLKGLTENPETGEIETIPASVWPKVQ